MVQSSPQRLSIGLYDRTGYEAHAHTPTGVAQFRVISNACLPATINTMITKIRPRIRSISYTQTLATSKTVSRKLFLKFEKLIVETMTQAMNKSQLAILIVLLLFVTATDGGFITL